MPVQFHHPRAYAFRFMRSDSDKEGFDPPGLPDGLEPLFAFTYKVKERAKADA